MALATPEFLQTKTYSALRDRLAFAHGGPIQAGVWDAGDFKATQRAAGANMSVDVAAGAAVVAANDPGNAGLYHVTNDATVNVPQPTAAHATLPRLDSLYVQVNDTTHGGDATDVPAFGWATGVATAGATLDNRLGATAVPTGALLLADVLVPAAATTMVTANIRDRRAWVRGFNYQHVRGAGDITMNVQTPTVIDPTNWQVRCEITGNSEIEVNLRADAIRGSIAGLATYFDLFLDGVSMSMARSQNTPSPGYDLPLNFSWRFPAPAAGSHIIAPVWWNNTSATSTIAGGTVAGQMPPRFSIVEIGRQNANNN